MVTLFASVFRDWFAWPSGGVWSNIVASILWTPIGVVAGYLGALRHLHCHEKGCFRPATVPVSDTVHKVCKKHALEHGHTH